MDQVAFERGRKKALEHLAAWRELGFRSPEACRKHLRRKTRTGVLSLNRSPNRQARVGTTTHSRWVQEMSYQQGFLSALK